MGCSPERTDGTRRKFAIAELYRAASQRVMCRTERLYSNLSATYRLKDNELATNLTALYLV